MCLFLTASLLCFLFFELLKSTLLFILCLALPLELFLLKAVALSLLSALGFKSFFLFLSLLFKSLCLLTSSSLGSLTLNVCHKRLIA